MRVFSTSTNDDTPVSKLPAAFSASNVRLPLLRASENVAFLLAIMVVSRKSMILELSSWRHPTKAWPGISMIIGCIPSASKIEANRCVVSMQRPSRLRSTSMG